VSGEAAAELAAHLAKGEIDLVVEHDHVIERYAESAAGRAGRRPRLVHEGLGKKDRDPGAARPHPPLADQAAEALAGAGKLPAAAELVRDLKADVVPGPGVAGPGIAEPDHEHIGSRRSPLGAAI
jgi:hypothetical protein